MPEQHVFDVYREALLEPKRLQKNILLQKHKCIRESFEATRSDISHLLQQSDFFHGTGRFHYQNNGQSKYEGINHGTVSNTFTSIAQNGIRPQYDPYADILRDDTDRTTSLTRNRLYARVYAGMFASSPNDMFFEYGSRAFWWSNVVLQMMMRRAKMGSGPRKEKHFYQNVQKLWNEGCHWTKSFRHDDVSPLKALSCVMPYGISDIPNNHPVIVGTKKNAVSSFPIQSVMMSMYESRTIEDIPPASINHLEVPWAFVPARRQELKDLGIDIPVIPLEFVEMILSERHFSELIEPRG